VFEARDVSYIRRLRVLYDLLLAAHACEKDFADADRADIDRIVTFMHRRYKSPKSKRDFILDLRFSWKLLFPENDRQGRPDDTVVPYPVRHLGAKIERSKEHMRNDRLAPEEFEQLVAYFSNEPRIQAYIMLAVESLGRPQELLTRKIKHVELYDCYAKVWLTERGKEGPGGKKPVGEPAPDRPAHDAGHLVQRQRLPGDDQVESRAAGEVYGHERDEAQLQARVHEAREGEATEGPAFQEQGERRGEPPVDDGAARVAPAVAAAAHREDGSHLRLGPGPP